jgi:hypothetical protein
VDAEVQKELEKLGIFEEFKTEGPLVNKLFSNKAKVTLENGEQCQKLSWVGAAHGANVPIRADTSGTATLTAIGLRALASETLQSDSKSTKHFNSLCILAPFEFGDYHTIAESQAGLDHERAERSKKDEKASLKRDGTVGPAEALCRGVKHLVKLIDDENHAEAAQLADQIMSKIRQDYYVKMQSHERPKATSGSWWGIGSWFASSFRERQASTSHTQQARVEPLDDKLSEYL